MAPKNQEKEVSHEHNLRRISPKELRTTADVYPEDSPFPAKSFCSPRPLFALGLAKNAWFTPVSYTNRKNGGKPHRVVDIVVYTTDKCYVFRSEDLQSEMRDAANNRDQERAELIAHIVASRIPETLFGV